MDRCAYSGNTGTNDAVAYIRAAKQKKTKDDGRAPYADGKCAFLKQRSRSKIDWDYVTIKNRCNFPIQVLTCYYMKGEEGKCDPSRKSSWGTSDMIKAGGQTAGVSSTKSWPFLVKYFVCDMTAVKNHSKLCLLPKT
ncbi:hypothetical protein J2Z31_001744 [Sinorhizobium kostiense]|uniref:Uncharacterized protein n=1 Tax=Sinorhizobium kostiense TaxID=76747 RepID=A0ABS4QX85_9HYPH|nr:hypothetical protein [Sinorhizobium kostiense]MBP2235252.1 hypothetical protein [Sinorhizobium kostiense]